MEDFDRSACLLVTSLDLSTLVFLFALSVSRFSNDGRGFLLSTLEAFFSWSSCLDLDDLTSLLSSSSSELGEDDDEVEEADDSAEDDVDEENDDEEDDGDEDKFFFGLFNLFRRLLFWFGWWFFRFFANHGFVVFADVFLKNKTSKK